MQSVVMYRITRECFLNNFTGMGDSFTKGGRWNPRGIPASYFALSASTAALEMGNYIGTPTHVPIDYRLGIYEIPRDLLDTFDTANLPPNWNVYPHPTETQELGRTWIQSNSNVGLIVPSAASPSGVDNSVVINSSHPFCEKIKLIEVKDSIYNPRLFGGLHKKKNE